MKIHIKELIQQAILDLCRANKLDLAVEPDVEIEKSKNHSFGDYSTNIAMVLAKETDNDSIALANEIVKTTPKSQHIDKIEIIKPGFINFYLNIHCFHGVLKTIFEQVDGYGSSYSNNESVHIEFVSANPNGPLHVGHGRAAAIGSTLANLLKFNGYDVFNEYYVNDGGRQMELLTLSIWLKYLELCGFNFEYPNSCYQGDYITNIARKIKINEGDKYKPAIFDFKIPFIKQENLVFCENMDESVLAHDFNSNNSKDLMNEQYKKSHDVCDTKEKHYINNLIGYAKSILKDDFNTILNIGLAYCMDNIKNDLNAFDVKFDSFFYESELFKSGYIEKAIDILNKNELIYIKDNNIYYKSTEFGDEKDLLIKRGDEYTYFAADLGYLLSKIERGHDKFIYLLGTDHEKYSQRLISASYGLGIQKNNIKIILIQFANLIKNNKKEKISTRGGVYLSLIDLLNHTGKDETRYFYLKRSLDKHIEFDLEHVMKKTNDNPLYYVQYAYARIQSIISQVEKKHLFYNKTAACAASYLLNDIHEVEILADLILFPEIIKKASNHYDPHLIINFLYELAHKFHSYYGTIDIVVENHEMRNARVGLCIATGIVIKNCCTILQINLPTHINH
jgi:arginyl-tRNA synthetase